jgi:hypothetical protein
MKVERAEIRYMQDITVEAEIIAQSGATQRKKQKQKSYNLSICIITDLQMQVII